MNKLDYLAQKEEELRKINEMLDSQKDTVLKKAQNFSEKPLEQPKKDIFTNNAWTFNEPTDNIEEEKNQYEEEEEQQNDHISKRILQAEEQISQSNNTNFALGNDGDSEEQTKIIRIQKAKILALQSELEETIKKMNLMEIDIDQKDAKKTKENEEIKKLNEKVTQLNAQVAKQKTVNQEQQQKIQNYENQLKEQNREIDAVERQNRKQNMDNSSKEAKLNRLVEENDKLKQQLREAKLSE